MPVPRDAAATTRSGSNQFFDQNEPDVIVCVPFVAENVPLTGPVGP